MDFSAAHQPAILEMWNQSLLWDPINEARFVEKVLCDENFDPSLALVARRAGEPAGFLLATKRRVPYRDRGLEPGRGYINLMFTAPQQRGKGVGGALLAEAEARLAARGASELVLAAYSPNYFFPGIDSGAYPAAAPFFEHRGWARGEAAYSMQRTLFGFAVPAAVAGRRREAEGKGFAFVRFAPRYALPLLQFLQQNFTAGWQRGAARAIEAGTARDTIWLCLDGAGAIAGYCQRAMDGNACRFGPFGVRADCRSHGLGGILLCAMLEDMVRRGLYVVFFLSTDGRARRFYERYGFAVYRTQHHYTKTLGDAAPACPQKKEAGI